MFKFFFLQYFRSIKQDKLSFIINVIGLSTSLACAIIIYLWVNDEQNIDKFHEKDKQLFQVLLSHPHMNAREGTQGLLAKALVEEMPEVELASSVIYPEWHKTPGIISHANKHIKAKEQYVGEDYFKMFSYKLLHGNKNNIFPHKNAVLISNEMAEKLFQTTENLIGKTIDWNRDGKENVLSGTYTISGVFEKAPLNSSVQFDLVLSYSKFFDTRREDMESWYNHNPQTFIVLKEGTIVNNFKDKIKGYIKTKAPESHNSLLIRPYSDRYLYFAHGGGRIIYVRLFSAIAIFILLIACINFMNLSTAAASRKTKEIGIKKVIGSRKKSLIFQYMGESLTLSFISLIIALFLVALFIPHFNTITGKQLSLSIDFKTIWVLVLITTLMGLISGSYPSFYLSRFNPVIVLKGKILTSFGESFIRKGLVIFQFSISIILILSSIVIFRQLRHIQTKNLGYNQDNVIWFKAEGALAEKTDAFFSELNKIPGIINVSSSGTNLTGYHGNTTSRITVEGGKEQMVYFHNMRIGYDFIETLGMELLQGRSYSSTFTSEQSKIIFNESAIKKLGITDPIGKRITFWHRDWEIIGVVKDFNLVSLHTGIESFFFRCLNQDEFGKNIWVKIQSSTELATIDQIKSIYSKFNPGLQFEFNFLDDELQAQYQSEKRVAILSKYFSAITILISCLGLFGLTTFTIRKRTKEIGIRKVNGSTSFGITNLVMSDFMKLVMLSLIISLPIGYFINENWLNKYAYRIDLDWWMFFATGFIVLLISIVTVGLQALKVANINPVICLKDE